MPRNFLSEIVALFGHPVAENPTQEMHERSFAELGMDWRYVTLDVPAASLPDAILGMRAMNFAGANCTIPHKVNVIPLLDEITPAARRIGAVNTIVRRPDGGYLGENTDGKGFLRSLTGASVDARGAHAVILGAGGAARAIAVELADAGAARLTIVNRSPDRGGLLAEHLARVAGARVTFSPLCGPYAVPADTQLLVNATSVGLYPDLGGCFPIDTETLRREMVVCDVIPNPPNTPFLELGRAAGCLTLDGLGMLVYQGAIGFELWVGRPAPEATMRQALVDVFDL